MMNPYQIVSSDSLLIGHAYLVRDVENLDLANLRFVLSSPEEDVDQSQPDSSLSETSDSFSSPAKVGDKSESSHCQVLPEMYGQNNSLSYGLESFPSAGKVLQGNGFKPEYNENTSNVDANTSCENVDSSLYYSKGDLKRLGKPFDHGFQRVCFATYVNGVPSRVTTAYYLSPLNNQNRRNKLSRCDEINEAIKNIPELSKDNFSFHRKMLGFSPNLEIIKQSTLTPCRSNLLRHVKIMKDPKIVFCTLCSKITGRNSLSRHMKMKHNSSKKTSGHSGEAFKATNEASCDMNTLKLRNRKAQTDKHSPERNSASLIGEEIDLSMESLTADDTDEEENITAVVEYNTDEEQNVKEVVVNCTDKEEIKQIVKGYDTDENKNTPKVGDDSNQPSVSNYKILENGAGHNNLIPYIAVKSKPVFVESLSPGFSHKDDPDQEGQSESERVVLTMQMAGRAQVRMMSKTGIRMVKLMKKFARKIGVERSQLQFLQERRVGLVEDRRELRGEELVGELDQSNIVVDWKLNS